MKKMTKQQKIALAAIGAGGAIGAALYYWTQMKGTTEDLLAPLDTSNIPLSFIPGDGGGTETPTTPTTTPPGMGSTGSGGVPLTPTVPMVTPTTPTTPETTTPLTTTPETPTTTTLTPSVSTTQIAQSQGAIAQMTFLGQAIPMLGLGVRAVPDWLAPFYALGWTLSRTFIARPLETAITANAPAWLKPILSGLSTIQEIGPFGALLNWLTGGPTGTWQGSVANVLANPLGAITSAAFNFIPQVQAKPMIPGLPGPSITAPPAYHEAPRTYVTGQPQTYWGAPITSMPAYHEAPQGYVYVPPYVPPVFYPSAPVSQPEAAGIPTVGGHY
jgi:hypothetical protein